ncbi:4Fe-4S dicluster domain-containing protein [Salisediminibacterium beveridgei]|uniref:4Fe-4S ferredoxin, iron-sulfur binding n=1 Tax=Salisediminibacterium beveridgei TaxID=632773 RepID=A0A1D7QWV5_9BACI|nr:4Fe-4S dicluster domain-containing protein [Salisediminibacterium beveridgei]AOM83492.1 4Fe-4S ferredoxin, iron-sulfur binding [Salisediminibacterium beveridgei]
MAKKNYAMTIDLQACIGCAGCAVTCKNENNTVDGINWMHYTKKETGEFPHVRYDFMPTLCNHCDNAPCIKACPVTAMYKDEDGLTLHDADRCIGCKACMTACPYGVISYNKENPHQYWNENNAWSELSATPKEVQDHAGAPIPYHNPERDYNYESIRYRGIVEKCQFCDHRLARDEQPYCVDRCPSEAMYVGDLNDPDDKIHELLKYSHEGLKEELGTKPKVFYLRKFSK